MKKTFLIFVCILWMGLIFYNSSNPGSVSHKQSMEVVDFITGEETKAASSSKVTTVTKAKQSSQKQTLNKAKLENKLDYIVRKNAHAFEYMILAVFISALLFALKLKGKYAIVYILFICLFYAELDEFHQRFVSMRTSTVTDVLIDFGGSIIGMIVFYAIYYRKKIFNMIDN